MFTKKSIIFHTKILLSILIFHFVLTTFLRYQLWTDMGISFLNNNLINLWKDIYLVFIYWLIIWYSVKNKTYKIIKNHPVFFLSIIILVLLSLILTWFNHPSLKQIIIWFKYDIWFLLPAFLYALVNFDSKDIKDFYKFFIKLIKVVIVFSLIFAFIRFTMPKFLFLIWYGPLWDWKPNTPPPMYFNTWIYWIQRLSGIFSGPNHMAFYFIAFWPFILLSILFKKIHPIWGILYLGLLIWTLSRSGLLALIWEVTLLTLYLFITQKHLRKKIIGLGIWLTTILAIFIGYLFVSWKYHQVLLRWASTKGHFIKAKKTIQYIKQKPLIGHWIWTAGPAAHYIKSDIIPESWILQIIYELGIVWWLTWFFVLWLITYYLTKNKNNNILESKIIWIWLAIWIIWLIIQWIVLHSFEDAIVSLSLFIFIWIYLGWLFNTQLK